MANTKNYMEQGGDKLVIGGELAIETNGSVSGLPLATTSAAGVVKKASGMSALSSSAGLSDVITAWNSLKTALQTAGIVEVDE